VSEPRKYVCLCCLLRGMRARTDKKGRLFWQCESCGAIIFPRGGHIGLFSVAHTLRLLDTVDAQRYVRREAFAAAEAGESALMDLLRPAPTVASTAPQLSKEAQAEVLRTGT